MSPEVTAAIIAGSVGIVTVIATVIVQIVGFRSTKANTEQQIKATHKDTADTLGQQSEHLDKTLAEQREQLDRTLAEQRTRTLNERFATAAEQLGSDKPAVRLAGVHAMAGLADDWEENRQTCVDVLCAYLRMPYEPDPGQDAPEPQRLAFQAIREVRHTVIRVITAHLKEGAAVSWQGLDFDFTGVVFDGGDFRGAEFSGGTVHFTGAEFSGGTVSFDDAEFSGGEVDFSRRRVLRRHGQLHRRRVLRRHGQLQRRQVLRRRRSTSAPPSSPAARSASHARQCSPAARSASAAPSSLAARSTSAAGFSGGTVDFHAPSSPAARSTSASLTFSGGTVDFSGPGDWSVPPTFPWTDTPPSGVIAPEAGRPIPGVAVNAAVPLGTAELSRT